MLGKRCDSDECKRLPRDFFTRDGLTMARELLGKILVHETPEGTIRGIITEVESYMGVEDKGSHTYGGRRTKRTEPMFLQGGNSYVYFTYGMYYCMNITSGKKEDPQAVLIRSVIPADEKSQMLMLRLRMEAGAARSIRGDMTERDSLQKRIEKHLADGPGKMCIAMGITKEHNAVDMVESAKLYVTEGSVVEKSQIKSGKRIGIDYAEEAADYLWRFYL